MRRSRLLAGLALLGAVAALSAVVAAQPWQPEYPQPSHWEGLVRGDIHLAWGEHHYQLIVRCQTSAGTACQPNTYWTYQLVPLSTQVGQTIKYAASHPNQSWASIDGFWVAIGAPPHNGTIFVREIKLGPPPAEPDGRLFRPYEFAGGFYLY